MRKIRRWFKSLTINFGLLLSMAGYFQDNLVLVMPFVKSVLPNEQVGLFVMGVGILVILLRFKTTLPLSER